MINIPIPTFGLSPTHNLPSEYFRSVRNTFLGIGFDSDLLLASKTQEPVFTGILENYDVLYSKDVLRGNVRILSYIYKGFFIPAKTASLILSRHYNLPTIPIVESSIDAICVSCKPYKYIFLREALFFPMENNFYIENPCYEDRSINKRSKKPPIDEMSFEEISDKSVMRGFYNYPDTNLHYYGFGETIQNVKLSEKDKPLLIKDLENIF